MKNDLNAKIAYFSMEIALESSIKTYAGGLGILAGDTLRSAADLKVPMIGITLLNDRGYFKQKISEEGEQMELPASYEFSKLKRLKNIVNVKIGKDNVRVGVWQYNIIGRNDNAISVYLLDTRIKGNKSQYFNLTGQLYNADHSYRLMQEIILGRAGVKMVKSLGYKKIEKFHINEGHGSLAAVELFLNSKKKNIVDRVKEVQGKCVFTTHTPVFAGHDIFSIDFFKEYQKDFPYQLENLVVNNEINMTRVALYFSDYINGVTLRHKDVSKKMFPDFPIHAITNGVHSETWTADEFKELFDKHIPNWRNSSLSLRNALNIPLSEIWSAHQKAKRRLLDYIYKTEGTKLSATVFTIGFARRFTKYKRPTLLFSNMEELLKINDTVGKIQIVFAGKAHPNDLEGKEMIKEIFNLKKKYSKRIKIVFLEGYDMDLARLMVAGVDVWLNTPTPPQEASGTSGMKAAHNGVPHVSILDGWWIEGFINRKTGWAIGTRKEPGLDKNFDKEDANSLYFRLGERILPRYYNEPQKWRETMRHTIAINASYFNTERMLQEYAQEAYL